MVFDIFGAKFETTYEKLETELGRALGDVLFELTQHSSVEVIQQSINHVSGNDYSKKMFR